MSEFSEYQVTAVEYESEKAFFAKIKNLTEVVHIFAQQYLITNITKKPVL